MKHLFSIVLACLTVTATAQVKLSDLIEGTTVVGSDLIPFVDVSDTTQAASGSTKKATMQTLSQAVGTVGAKTWLLLPSVTNTITPSESGIGWADEMMTIQTPVGALQFDEVGDPAEAVIYWPGRFEVGVLEAAEIQGEVDADNITTGTIDSGIVANSLPSPHIRWVDSADQAGDSGLTYTNTGPLSVSEPSTPGDYFAILTVTDGGVDNRNNLTGTIKTHAQMAVPQIVTVPGSASATGEAGQMAYDASYLYICTATNTWKRVAIASW